MIVSGDEHFIKLEIDSDSDADSRTKSVDRSISSTDADKHFIRITGEALTFGGFVVSVSNTGEFSVMGNNKLTEEAYLMVLDWLDNVLKVAVDHIRQVTMDNMINKEQNQIASKSIFSIVNNGSDKSN